MSPEFNLLFPVNIYLDQEPLPLMKLIPEKNLDIINEEGFEVWLMGLRHQPEITKIVKDDLTEDYLEYLVIEEIEVL